MKMIQKYPLKITDVQTLTIPGPFEPLTVQMQGDKPCLWVQVDLAQESSRKLRVAIHGTGHWLRSDIDKYLGTFQLLEGALVFHAFTLKD